MSDTQRCDFPAAGPLVHRITPMVYASDSAGFADMPGD